METCPFIRLSNSFFTVSKIDALLYEIYIHAATQTSRNRITIPAMMRKRYRSVFFNKYFKAGAEGDGSRMISHKFSYNRFMIAAR